MLINKVKRKTSFLSYDTTDLCLSSGLRFYITSSLNKLVFVTMLSLISLGNFFIGARVLYKMGNFVQKGFCTFVRHSSPKLLDLCGKLSFFLKQLAKCIKGVLKKGKFLVYFKA